MCSPDPRRQGDYMEELINVSYDVEQKPFVMGRDLHEALRVRTAYRDWFPRMCEYGFEEGRDFRSILSESSGGRPGMDHQLSIDMAKELCMLQRTDIGKRCVSISWSWSAAGTVRRRSWPGRCSLPIPNWPG